MKTTSIMLLIVLISFLNIPVQINVPVESRSHTSSIFTLDVCNQHNSAGSVNSDTPVILEYQHDFTPLTTQIYHNQNNHVFNPFLVTSQDERPPEA